MSSRKKKANRQRGYVKGLRQSLAPKHCWNCDKFFLKNDEGHFVPPSLGQKGFYICEKKNDPSNTPSS